MAVIKGFIFDLDGVIVDTAKFHYLAWKRLANELGFDFTEEQNEMLKGVSRMTSLDILLKIGKKSLSQEEKEHLAAKKNEWYLEFISKMAPGDILPGVSTFLMEVRSAGIKMAIGSASKNAKTILTHVGLIDLFDAIVDGTVISEAKPNPEVFLKGAKELGLTPKECLVFEDSIAGVDAAHNGDMKCVGIGSKTTLRNADVVINGFKSIGISDLMELLDLLNVEM